MITLRRYNEKDAQAIVSWIKDEKAFRLWCADRFDRFPLSAKEFDSIYSAESGLSGMVAEDDGVLIGHLFIQHLGERKYKFGLKIIDGEKRGKGYGKSMLEAAMEYTATTLGADSVILNAFDTNPAAYGCYKALGFSETGNVKQFRFFCQTHNYIELSYSFPKKEI